MFRKIFKVFKVFRIFRFARPSALRGLIFNVRLIYHLVRDPRVSLFLKVIPVLSVAYLAHPDFFILPLDDILVVTLGMRSFLKLVPAPIVAEHSARLSGQVQISREAIRG